MLVGWREWKEMGKGGAAIKKSKALRAAGSDLLLKSFSSLLFSQFREK